MFENKRKSSRKNIFLTKIQRRLKNTKLEPFIHENKDYRWEINFEGKSITLSPLGLLKQNLKPITAKKSHSYTLIMSL